MTKTHTIELTDVELERLMNVLHKNVAATGQKDALRWTNEAAFRIDQVRREIEEQTE